MALGRERGSRPYGPDMLAEAMAAVATVADHPFRHARQPLKQRDGMGQFVRLAGCDAESDGAISPIGDHARLGSIPATRAAKRFACVSLGARASFRLAPAAF